MNTVDIISVWQAERTAAGKRAEANTRRLLEVLRAHNVESVCVSFCGGGDDGQIDDINIEPRPDPEPTVEIEQQSSRFDNETKQFVPVIELKSVPLTEAIESVVYDAAEATGVDWYNNEGGAGDWELDVKSGQLEFTIDYFIQSRERAYSTTEVIA